LHSIDEDTSMAMASRILSISMLLVMFGACARTSDDPELPRLVPAEESAAIAADSAAQPASEGGADSSPSNASRRQSEAQAYLDAAKERAQKNFSAAVYRCASLAGAARGDCEQQVDENREAELRAARVEFDARMTNNE
jgi:hypothetical protein